MSEIPGVKTLGVSDKHCQTEISGKGPDTAVAYEALLYLSDDAVITNMKLRQ